jgi:hypothetical protein
MTSFRSHLGLISAAALLWASACSNSKMSPTGTGTAGSGSGGSGGSSSPGTGGGTSNAGTGGTPATGAGGSNSQAGTGGQAGTGTGTGGSAGAVAAGGTGGGSTAGAGGAGGSTTGASGAGGGTTTGAGGDGYPPDPRPINVMGTGTTQGSYAGGQYYLNKNKPAQGKLVLFLGGICGGAGSGGIDGFFHNYGFHIFMPKTDTCLDGGKVPQTYARNSTTDTEANRQIGDSRMELWDGKSRVTWYNVDPSNVILTATVGLIKQETTADPGGDWGFFLNADGTLRTSDVWVVGYSWGSQTWAMISAYVPFGRVITTSGPQDEGFPNALWITSKSAAGTPGDRKYMLIGFNNAYPSTQASDNLVMGMVTTVTNAGWPGMVTNVTLTSPGPYMSAQHLFAMIGGNGGISPGGHTIFCTGGSNDQWNPVCDYVAGQ